MPLRWTDPRDVNRCMQDATVHLTKQLQRLVCAPVSFSPDNASVPRDFYRRTAACDCSYAINIGEPSRCIGAVEIQRVDSNDQLSRKLAATFALSVGRMLSTCKQPWSVKAALIRHETWLWDDLVFSQSYSGAQKYAAIATLRTVRESLFFRYEGKETPIGVLFSINWHKFSKRPNAILLTPAKRRGLEDALGKWKSLSVLADAECSVICATPKGNFGALIVTDLGRPTLQDGWETVSPRYSRLSSLIEGRDIVILNAPPNEQFMLTKEHAFKWRSGKWSRASSSALVATIRRHLDHKAASVVLSVLAEHSALHIGSLIVVLDVAESKARIGPPGLSSVLQVPPATNIADIGVPFVRKLCSLDGAMVIDKTGLFLDAGVIVAIPSELTTTTEGARTKAAIAASKFGTAVKVSADGPVDVFVNGVAVASAN